MLLPSPGAYSKVVKLLEYLTNKERRLTHKRLIRTPEKWMWYELIVEKA